MNKYVPATPGAGDGRMTDSGRFGMIWLQGFPLVVGAFACML